jgi:hypothetical protein
VDGSGLDTGPGQLFGQRQAWRQGCG